MKSTVTHAHQQKQECDSIMYLYIGKWMLTEP